MGDRTLTTEEMRSSVYYRDGRVRRVKNLGWLLRHAADVHTIVLSRAPVDGNSAHAHLRAIGRQWEYLIDYADIDVARQWIRRPSLDGVLVFVVNDGPTKQYAIDYYNQGYRVVGTDVEGPLGGALRMNQKPTDPDHGLNKPIVRDVV
jgi:hypothetical protein